MTDDQRFKLDTQLREQYEKAKADLSRQRQLATDYGVSLRNIGAGLEQQAETINIWRDDEKAEWRWTLSTNGHHLVEYALPEWATVREIAREIGRLRNEVARMERELRERKLL